MTGTSAMLSLPSEKPPRGAAYGYAVRMHVISLTSQGLTSYEISGRTGVDSSVIRRWIRRYRLYGHHSLQPYWRPDRRKDSRAERHADRDLLYREAYDAYVASREPVASITRRFNLDYHAGFGRAETFLLPSGYGNPHPADG